MARDQFWADFYKAQMYFTPYSGALTHLFTAREPREASAGLIF